MAQSVGNTIDGSGLHARRAVGILGLLLAASAVLFFTSVVQARSLQVKVVGPHDQPLQYAAVQLYWQRDHAPAVPAKPLIMAQRDLRFVPHMMIVPVGGAVAFPNYDKTRHHVYSFSRARTFDIKLYKGLPDQPVRFDKIGVVTLGCNIHDQMQAFLIVSDAPRAGITDTHGSVVFPETTSGEITVSIWHPWMATEQERVTRSVSPGEDTLTVHLDNIHAPPPSIRDNSLQKRFNALAG